MTTDMTTLKGWIKLYESGKTDAETLHNLHAALFHATEKIEMESLARSGALSASDMIYHALKPMDYDTDGDSDQEIMRKQHGLSREQMGIR